MRYAVRLTASAELDLAELAGYISRFDSPEKAHYVLNRLWEVVDSLTTLPQRGSVPREFHAMGMRQYRQVFFKPYRLIYSVEAKTVWVRVIADGRRDMASLLQRRLLAD